MNPTQSVGVIEHFETIYQCNSIHCLQKKKENKQKCEKFYLDLIQIKIRFTNSTFLNFKNLVGLNIVVLSSTGE